MDSDDSLVKLGWERVTMPSGVDLYEKNGVIVMVDTQTISTFLKTGQLIVNNRKDMPIATQVVFMLRKQLGEAMGKLRDITLQVENIRNVMSLLPTTQAAGVRKATSYTTSTVTHVVNGVTYKIKGKG